MLEESTCGKYRRFILTPMWSDFGMGFYLYNFRKQLFCFFPHSFKATNTGYMSTSNSIYTSYLRSKKYVMLCNY